MFNTISTISSCRWRFVGRDSRKNLLLPLYTVNFTTLQNIRCLYRVISLLQITNLHLESWDKIDDATQWIMYFTARLIKSRLICCKPARKALPRVNDNNVFSIIWLISQNENWKFWKNCLSKIEKKLRLYRKILKLFRIILTHSSNFSMKEELNSLINIYLIHNFGHRLRFSFIEALMERATAIMLESEENNWSRTLDGVLT